MNKNPKIGFIGAGKMAGAIIKGLCESGFCKKENITASEITEEIAKTASQNLGIDVITDNIELVKNSDIIILCVKPHFVKNVLEESKSVLNPDKLVISIAAGISIETMQNSAGSEIPIIRTMPNTPVLVNEGMTVVCGNDKVTKEQMNYVIDLFSSVGRCLEVSEKMINFVTGISGSGPAFIYLIIEAMADGGVKLGIPKETALELAAQTALGAAKMVLETRKHPSVLKDEVTTPGGCTAVGLSVLEDHNVRSSMIKTVQETARTASGLGN
jgi:pyrroline-5-carboxylate reductase